MINFWSLPTHGVLTTQSLHSKCKYETQDYCPGEDIILLIP